MAIAFGLSLGCLCLIVIGFGGVIWWRHKHNQQAFFDVKGTFQLHTLNEINFKYVSLYKNVPVPQKSPV